MNDKALAAYTQQINLKCWTIQFRAGIRIESYDFICCTGLCRTEECLKIYLIILADAYCFLRRRRWSSVPTKSLEQDNTYSVNTLVHICTTTYIILMDAVLYICTIAYAYFTKTIKTEFWIYISIILHNYLQISKKIAI